jgi:CheY-like chemotaxis protein
MLKLSNDGPVVMVDDNAGDLFFVERCYLSSKVTNPWLPMSRGTDFLEHLASVKNGQAPMPALVLLDLNMPGMTGLEILQAVRADTHFDQLPIFCVFTSSSDPREQRRAEDLGVNGFYTKTSSIDEYVAFFNALVT